MTHVATYRALQPCRAGGLFRNEGDEFTMTKLDAVPEHLEEVGGSEEGGEGDEAGKLDAVPEPPFGWSGEANNEDGAPKAPEVPAAPETPGPSLEAIAGMQATPAAQVNSASKNTRKK